MRCFSKLTARGWLLACLFAVARLAYCGVTAEIDLVSGRSTLSGIDSITLLSPPKNGMALVKIRIGRSCRYSRARFDIYIGEEPGGWLLDIGDSATNNGCAGDCATQSNDAEIDIKDGRLALWGSDYTDRTQCEDGHRRLGLVKGFVKPNSCLSIEIADGYAAWDNGAGLTGRLASRYLFALNGQTDSEGPVNFDVFVGINRVVDSVYRYGRGVERVVIHLFSDSEPDYGKQQRNWIGF